MSHIQPRQGETIGIFFDEMSNDLPLLGFDGEDESFDGESPQTEVAAEAEMEPATAVALDDDDLRLKTVSERSAFIGIYLFFSK